MTTKIRQKAHEQPLLALFASEARVAVLHVFMLDPSRAYYQRQIEAATGLPIRAVQRELERLSGAQLLYRREEGNRAYYQVDMQFPLFPELRAIILKTASPIEQLRGQLALEPLVRLVLYCGSAGRLLVVTTSGARPGTSPAGPFVVEVMSADEFARALAEHPESLHPFLTEGVDLLGRREDVLWRRIEMAGYAVPKGKGVP